MNPDSEPIPKRLQVTSEMRQAVADEQCDLLGHSLRAIDMYGRPDPAAVICARCGREWAIEQRPP